MTTPPTIETITPAKAKVILEKNTHNRHINLRTVTVYARAMKEKAWQLNGETIKLAKNGTLIDGQHRLLACIEANVNFKSFVVYELNPDMFDTIDVGRRRTTGDTLSVDGVPNANTAAACCRWIDAINNGATASRHRSVRPDEIRLIYADDSSLIEFAVSNSSNHKLISGGLASALYYFFSKKHRAKTAEFFELLKTGENLHAGHPVFVLRERLLKEKMSKAKQPQSEIASWVIRAWNAFRADETIKVLKGISKNAQGDESLPTIK